MRPELRQKYVELAEKLAKAKADGEREAIIEAACALLKKSRATVYRQLKEVAGWESGRTARKDAGESTLTTEYLREVSGLVLHAQRANGKQTMSIKSAVRILHANGKGVVNLETGEVCMPSPTNVERVMRQRGLHPAQLRKGRPVTEMQSLYPNHCWQIDGSQCVVFYLRNGTMGMMGEGEFYKNKPANVAKIEDARVWRYVVVDHYSGCFYVLYRLGAENAEDVARTLIAAMLPRTAHDPMRGRPEQLLLDKGSGNTSSLLKGFAEDCGIRLIYHATHASRTKGSVEKANDIVEREFEGKLSYMGITGLEDLQAKSDSWRTWFCATQKVKRAKLPRSACWATIPAEKLVVPESREMLEEMLAWPHKPVTVSPTLTISVVSKSAGKREYDVRQLPNVVAGEKLDVKLNPFRAPDVDVRRLGKGECWFTVSPVLRDPVSGFRYDAPVIGQEIRAAKKTEAERQLETMEKEAYAVPTMEQAEKAKAAKVRPYQHINVMADATETPLHFVPKGHALGGEKVRPAIPPLTVEDAACQLAERCPAWAQNPQAHMASLMARFPMGVPAEKLDELAAQLNRQADVLGAARKLAFRKAAGDES